MTHSVPTLRSSDLQRPSSTACCRREGNEQLAALAGCRPLLSNCHGQPLRHSPLDPVSGPYRLKAEGDDEERVAARRSFHLPQRPPRALRPFLVVGRAASRPLAPPDRESRV